MLIASVYNAYFFCGGVAQWIRHMPLVWETRVRHQCVPEQDT